MAISYRPFIPGSGVAPLLPLARFLPPLPAGMITAHLQQQTPKGSWLLDPIASTPAFSLEAARAGYRVLVVCNNPVLSFMLEVLAQAPSADEFRAAISELAASRRGDERLELHFQSLYQTECPECGRRIPLKALIWHKDDPTPVKRELVCPSCKSEGEFPLAPFDLERLRLPGNPSLHHARALERICATGDENVEGAREALRAYLPRSLYFCTTLINKIEGMSISAERRQLLLALALSVCDRANTLWPHPSGRSRPRQLSTPPEFREDNLWAAFEEAVPDWTSQPGSVPLVHWPDRPPETGGICLFSGRLRNLLPSTQLPDLDSALVVLPRPNQAFWTLSTIWSGWLWGREAVQPLSSALERRRYDWQWHASAIHSTLNILGKHLPSGFILRGLLPELVPGFLAAAMVAAEASGFSLDQISLSTEPEFAQIMWRSTPTFASAPVSRSTQRVIHEAVVNHLNERNEPSLYLPIYAAGMAALAENHLLPANQSHLAFDTLTRIQGMISEAFTDQTLFKRYDSRTRNIESGWWWLAHPTDLTTLPLSDRVEMAIVRYLLNHESCTLPEIEHELASQFPGLLTPPNELVQECLKSYAEMNQNLPGRWQFRTAEQPATRRNDLGAIQVGLTRLGKRLGFYTDGEAPVVWRGASGEIVLYLHPLVSGMISRAVLGARGPAEQCIMVIPGSRARLITYKIQHDPRLNEKIASGWRFMKFRLLRELLIRTDLDESLFYELLNSDPPTWEEATQMRFF